MITWARAVCADTAGLGSQELGGMYLGGFVHASTRIWLRALRRALPDKRVTEASEIVQVTFNDMKRCNAAQAMTTCTITRSKVS